MLNVDANSPLQNLHVKINSLVSKGVRSLFKFNQSHLVVCGFPRSGTSLLYNMISSCLPGYRFEPFEQYFIFRLHKLGNWATKAPLDVLHIKQIDKLNINKKDLAILIMVRDIRDVISSRHPIYPDEYFIGHDHSWWPQNQKFTEWRYDAPGVIAIHEAIQIALRRSDVMLLRYEDLVTNPDKIQEAIAKKFNLAFDARFCEYHKSPQKHAYRYEGRFAPKESSLVMEGKMSSSERIARWRRSPEQIERVRHQFSECNELFGTLEAYGYEKSRDWYSEIAS
ncbi:MAG: sulfotransferase domain-containing protein [Desulfobulbaceae bacterium]|nr:sulfotransferase domain-containing protein [Desulfobulbaceae bacterium]